MAGVAGRTPSMIEPMATPSPQFTLVEPELGAGGELRAGTSWMDRVAHDLRGPLSPVRTAVYLLRESSLADAQRDELLAMLERQIQRLSGMIDQFSDLGRAETGRLLARRESVDVEQLLGDLAGRLQGRSPRIELAPDVSGLQVEGDVLRLAQLFETLLGLRLVRGCVGPVQARVERTGDGLRMSCVLHCRDASDALVAGLLASPHPDPPDDSLGFGLPIAAAIASAHGGRLQGRATARDTVELVLDLPCAGARPE